MSKKRTPYNDRKYQAKAAALKRRTAREDLPCWVCHRSIDTRLHWKHAMSFTADHVEELAKGGALLGKLMPAHRGCNSRRSNAKELKPVPVPVTSRSW